MAGLGIRTMVWSGPRPGAPWPCSGAPAAVSLVLLTLPCSAPVWLEAWEPHEQGSNPTSNSAADRGVAPAPRSLGGMRLPFLRVEAWRRGFGEHGSPGWGSSYHPSVHAQNQALRTLGALVGTPDASGGC